MLTATASGSLGDGGTLSGSIGFDLSDYDFGSIGVGYSVDGTSGFWSFDLQDQSFNQAYQHDFVDGVTGRVEIETSSDASSVTLTFEWIF